MANVLVLTELYQGALLPVSLEALGQARRIATSLGATLYALLPLPEAPAYGDDDLIALCARHGADKVVLLTDETLSAEAEMRFGTHGRAVLAASDQLPPALLLMGATRAARDLAPRVAAHLGAVFVPEGWAAGDNGRLALHDRLGRPLRLEDDGPERTVVLTVPPGRYEPADGDDEAEMIIVAASGGAADFSEVEHRREAAWQVVGEGAEPGADPGAMAPSLVLAVGQPAPDIPGAVRVALGPLAPEDAGAHYALPVESTEVLAALRRAAPTGEDQ